MPDQEQKKIVILIAAKLIMLLLLPFYIYFRIDFILFDDIALSARIFSTIVFLVELYFVIQMYGYLLNVSRAIKTYPAIARSLHKKNPEKQPKVGVFIPVYNEPVDVVEETILAAKRMTYENKEVLVLDDSDATGTEEEIDGLAKRHAIGVMRRTNRIGFKAGCLNDTIAKTDCDYVVVLDADQQPESDFLSEVIPMMEGDGKLAYIQTPQSVRKASGNESGFIETAASAAQHVFYHYICEGKGTVNAQFSCGSNVVYRRKALEDLARMEGARIVYFDEWCITEDFATSILLHEKGWKSAYYTGTCARGLVPADLDSLNSQRRRWAVGTMTAFWRYLPKVLFGNFSLRQRWEYIVSGTYFLLGIANFLMLLNVMLLILYEVPAYSLLPFILFLSNTLVFYYSQNFRGNRPLDLFYEQIINFFMFPLYIEAFLIALLGRKTTFWVTPKTKGSLLQPKMPGLIMQKVALSSSVLVFFIGIGKYLTGGSSYILLNLIWMAYCIALLGAGLFLINRQCEADFQKKKSRAILPHLFGEGPVWNA